MSSEPSPGELTVVFAQLHGMLLSEQDATTAVGQLARAAQQLIPTAVGAGVSLLDEEGTRISTTATDTLVEAADAARYDLGQGPCSSARGTGEPQCIDDTTPDADGPPGTPRPRRAGFARCSAPPWSTGAGPWVR